MSDSVFKVTRIIEIVGYTGICHRTLLQVKKKLTELYVYFIPKTRIFYHSSKEHIGLEFLKITSFEVLLIP